MKGGLFLVSSKLLQRYSPKIPSIRSWTPETTRRTTMREAHPSMGLEKRSRFRITIEAYKNPMTYNNTATPEMSLMGK